MAVTKVPTWVSDDRSRNSWLSDFTAINLYHLTTVQLLKEINLDEIDDSVAWQYGQYYNTPWKDCWHGVKKFRQYHLPVVYGYVIDKCLQAICETASYLIKCLQMDLSTRAKLLEQLKKKLINRSVLNQFNGIDDIKYLGVSGAFVDQVDVILETGKLLKNAAKPHGRMINERYVGNLKQLCSKIEMMDKMAILQWNNVGNEQIFVSGEDNYLRQDQIRNLLEVVLSLVNNASNTTTAIVHRDFHFDTIRTAAYICSMLLHLLYLKTYRPEREEDLYKVVVATASSSYTDAIAKVREFSNKSLAYVLRMPFTISNPGFCPNHPEDRNEIQPFSLQERYLVLWYLYSRAMFNAENDADMVNVDLN